MASPLLIIPTLALIRNPFVREMLHFLCRPRRIRTTHIFAKVLGAGSSKTNTDPQQLEQRNPYCSPILGGQHPIETLDCVYLEYEVPVGGAALEGQRERETFRSED